MSPCLGPSFVWDDPRRLVLRRKLLKRKWHATIAACAWRRPHCLWPSVGLSQVPLFVSCLFPRRGVACVWVSRRRRHTNVSRRADQIFLGSSSRRINDYGTDKRLLLWCRRFAKHLANGVIHDAPQSRRSARGAERRQAQYLLDGVNIFGITNGGEYFCRDVENLGWSGEKHSFKLAICVS